MDLPSCAFTDHDEGCPVFGMGVVVVSGKRLQKPKGFLVVACFVSSGRILPIPRHHRRGEQHECGQGGEEGAHPKMLVCNAVALNLHGNL